MSKGRHRRRSNRSVRLGQGLSAIGIVGTITGLVTGAGLHPAPAETSTSQLAQPISFSDASASLRLSPPAPEIKPQPAPVIRPVVAETPSLGASVIASAKAWIGTPYQWGGTTKSGVDCSGLTRAVLKAQGISAPRTAAAQANWTERISKAEAEPGDLVFGTSGGVHHVGIYLGNNKMIDAPTEGKTVGVHSLYSDSNRFGRIPS